MRARGWARVCHSSLHRRDPTDIDTARHEQVSSDPSSHRAHNPNTPPSMGQRGRAGIARTPSHGEVPHVHAEKPVATC